jgi:hypothetical protein
MKKNILITLLVFNSISFTLLHAQQISMPDTLFALKASQQIVVDGKMDEPDWQNAKTYGLAFWKGTISYKAPQKTDIKLLWNEEFIYFFINSTDTNIALKDANELGMYDDMVEIMLNLIPKASDSYFQFQFNCGNKHNDWVFVPAMDGYRALAINAYNPVGIQKKCIINGTPDKGNDRDKGYQLEVAIPVSAFSNLSDYYAPNPINTWKIQIARFDKDAGVLFPLTYSTSESYNEDNPHYPKRQKYLKFIE